MWKNIAVIVYSIVSLVCIGYLFHRGYPIEKQPIVHKPTYGYTQFDTDSTIGYVYKKGTSWNTEFITNWNYAHPSFHDISCLLKNSSKSTQPITIYLERWVSSDNKWIVVADNTTFTTNMADYESVSFNAEYDKHPLYLNTPYRIRFKNTSSIPVFTITYIALE